MVCGCELLDQSSGFGGTQALQPQSHDRRGIRTRQGDDLMEIAVEGEHNALSDRHHSRSSSSEALASPTVRACTASNPLLFSKASAPSGSP